MSNKHIIPKCKDCFINNESFRKLTNEELDILSYTKNCNTYDKGDIIYNEGTRVTGIYCINSGIIKHYKTGNDGKEQIIRFSKTGDIFGFRAILSGDSACTTTKAIEESTVCYIPAAHFLKILKENSAFSMSIMKLSCQELGEANQYILDLSESKFYEDEIVTRVVALNNFYPAEDYHQDFLINNLTHPYITHWDIPKLEDLNNKYPQLLSINNAETYDKLNSLIEINEIK